MTIPRILHLTSGSVPLRGFEKRVAGINSRVLIGWKTRVWSDDDNRRLVGEQYPELLQPFDDLPLGVIRADVARLLYVHAFGGWYADCDYEWLVDPTAEFGHATVVLPYSRDEVDGEPVKIGNAVFGSTAHHPVWLALAHGVLAKPSADVRAATVEGFSGPDHITSMLPTISSYGDITMPPRSRFHPVVTAAARADPHSVGLHHTQASWRPWSLRQDLAWRRRSWPF